MDTLTTTFGETIKNVMALSKATTAITEENVYQEADKNIVPFLDKMAEYITLPGSGIDGFENLEELYAKAESGKSCLLLLEHYSNMDLTLFCSLVKKNGSSGEKIDKSIVAIAGMKLNEDSPVVSAFASAYTRIVIYPSRSLKGPSGEKDKSEVLRSLAINRAAMKKLVEIKTKGRLVLLFPSGTRYRPWDPSTKKGVREIDSYIKSFDCMCMVALNGQVLHVNQGNMMDDVVTKDVVRLSIGHVLSCKDFRDKIRTEVETNPLADKKQAVADAIMAELEIMHTAGEEKRKKFL